MENNNRDKILDLVIRSVKEIGTDKYNKHLINVQPDTELYGKNGYLDSLMLLRLIISLEDKLSTEMGKDISIADIQTMNKISSPFRTIDTLVVYIEGLLNQLNS